jgi:hypothetical protein
MSEDDKIASIKTLISKYVDEANSKIDENDSVDSSIEKVKEKLEDGSTKRKQLLEEEKRKTLILKYTKLKSKVKTESFFAEHYYILFIVLIAIVSIMATIWYKYSKKVDGEKAEDLESNPTER